MEAHPLFRIVNICPFPLPIGCTKYLSFLYLCLPNKDKRQNDSLHCRETFRGTGHRRRAGSKGEERRIHRRKRIPSDVDLRAFVHPERTARIYARMEVVAFRVFADDSAPLRHQIDRQPHIRKTIPHHRTADAGSGHDYQLRRCGPRGRTDSTLGDAESRSALPREASVDFLADRRGHPRGLCQAARCVRFPTTIRSRIEPCHRRLAAGDERHAPLHDEIWTKPASTLHRTCANAYAGIDCQPTTGNRTFRAQAILGAEHGISGHDLYGTHPEERRGIGCGSRKTKRKSRTEETEERRRQPGH